MRIAENITLEEKWISKAETQGTQRQEMVDMFLLDQIGTLLEMDPASIQQHKMYQLHSLLILHIFCCSLGNLHMTCVLCGYWCYCTCLPIEIADGRIEASPIDTRTLIANEIARNKDL